jgi:hypothetical protein
MGVDVQPVREDQQLLPLGRGPSSSTIDDALAAFDRRRAVGAEAGPVGHPVRRVAQNVVVPKASGSTISRLPP